MKEWVRLLKAILSHLRKHKKKEKTWSGIFCFAIPLKKEKCIPEKQSRPAYGQYYPHGWHRWSRNSRSGTEHELRGETMCSRKDLFFWSNKRTALWDYPKELGDNMAWDYTSSDISGNLPRNWQFWWNPKKLQQIDFIMKTKHGFPSWRYDPIICVQSLCVPIWYMKFLRGHVLAGPRWRR